MPLVDSDNNEVITAHASKKSTVSLKVFEAHTSVLVPLLIIPVMPFWVTIKYAFLMVLILILLERRGWTLSIALKRLRSRIAGRYRYRRTRIDMIKRMKG